jgi:DNA-binding transcriptional LysR family regulator
MQMNPRQIEAFRAVMLTGSMTVAAELLKITQPAVSRLIKDLEADLKLTLFRREGNRLVPSHEATILFAEVDRFYVGMDRIAKIAADLRQAKVGTLRVASIGALSLSCITQAISAFHIDRPAVSVMLESLNSRLILELVAGRHFDVGFAQVGGEFPGADLTPLPSVEAVCVAPAHYEIASKEVLEPADLKDLPFITLGQNSPLRLKIDQAFKDAGVVQHELLQTSLAASAIGLVASGLGVSIVDPFTASYLSPIGVVRRPFRPRIVFDVSVVRPAYYQHSRLSQDFIEIMVELFKKENRRYDSQVAMLAQTGQT